MSWPSSHSVSQGELSATRLKWSREYDTENGLSTASVAIQGLFAVSAALTANRPCCGEWGMAPFWELLVWPHAQA